MNLNEFESWFSAYASSISGSPSNTWFRTVSQGVNIAVVMWGDKDVLDKIGKVYPMNYHLTDIDFINIKFLGAKMIAEVEYKNHESIKFHHAQDSKITGKIWDLYNLRLQVFDDGASRKPLILGGSIDFIPISLEIDKIKVSCDHDIKEYVGAWEVFNYCTKCGKKESELGRS